MGWDKKYINYGVVKINKNNIKVYKDQFTAIPISTDSSVRNALWTGDELTVYLENGKVRKYVDQFTYKVI